MAGAPKGNSNAKDGLEARQSLKRALARLANEKKGKGKASPNDPVKTWRDGLDKLMDEYVAQGLAGQPWALKDVIDRIDGKAAQSVVIGGDPENPVGILPFEFVAPDPK